MLLEQADDVALLGYADYHIRFRIRRGGVLLHLRQTAGQHGDGFGVFALRAAERLAAFAVRDSGDGAGIYYTDVGRNGVGDVSRRGEQTGHIRAVVLIRLAAECDYLILHKYHRKDYTAFFIIFQLYLERRTELRYNSI